MTVQLDWPPDVVDLLADEARKKGLSLDAYLLQTALKQKGYIQGTVHARHSEVMIDAGGVLSDQEPNPERRAIEEQNTQVAMRVLQSLPKRDREVLARFYLL